MQKLIFRIAFLTVSVSALPAWAQTVPRVELELMTEQGFPPTGSQRWLQALKDVGFSEVRIRQARPGDRVEIRQRGSEDRPSYQVTGLLTAGNTLAVPGGQFQMHDKAGLKAWLDKVREGGEKRLQEKEGAFGLTPTQLVDVHEALSPPVTFSTKGERGFDVLRRVAGGLSLSFLSDPAVRRAMAGDDLIADELQGLSSGTVIAAVLRPLGLVLVPRKESDGEIKLWITDVRSARESWPVGWPPEKKPLETAPALFNNLNVEIADTPLSEALEAVGGRIELRMLYDHNSLARHRIDPAETKVSMPAGRTYYLRIIDRMVNQAQLKSELRVDEAGTPFMWISTIKR
jgi:hypothetical protein